MPFVLEAVRLVREALPDEKALIGFCGGPFTVAGYLIEGKPTRDFVKTKRCMYGSPEVWHELMDAAERDVPPLRAREGRGRRRRDPALRQLGRRAVGRATTRSSSRPTRSGSCGGLAVPTIHFGTGTAHLLESMAAAGGDVIGLDWRVPLDEGWARVGHDRGVQGNLDPARAARALGARRGAALDGVLRAAGGRPGHIFNLGHGVLAGHRPGRASARFVELVHERPRTR